MIKHRIYTTSFARVYPEYVAKAEKKGRTKAEVDEIIADLKSKGVKIIKEPQKAFWGGYSSYFADPDDYRWEVAYNPFFEFDENGNLKLD